VSWLRQLIIYYTTGWGIMSVHYFMLTMLLIGLVCLLALCVLRSSAESALRDSLEGVCGHAAFHVCTCHPSYYPPTHSTAGSRLGSPRLNLAPEPKPRLVARSLSFSPERCALSNERVASHADHERLRRRTDVLAMGLWRGRCRARHPGGGAGVL
jgi:hypothetical protein